MNGFLRRPLLAACAAAALAMGFAACGDDDDDGGSASSGSTAASTQAAASTTAAEPAGGDVVAKAAAEAEKYKTVDKIGPTKPIGKPVPKDKTIVAVNCGQPACTNQIDAFKVAATALGWKTEVIQAQPTPEAVQAAFTEALRRKPDGIWSAGFGRSLYPRQLDQAKADGIPIMSITGNEETGEGGIAYEPLGPKGASEATSHLAYKTIADIGGEGEVGIVLLGGYPLVKTYTKGYTDTIEQNCPKCTLKQMDLQPTSLGKDAAQLIANFIRANPDMKALFYSYDLMGSGVPAAAKGAGVEVPKTYSWAPDAPGLQALRTGERTAADLMPYPELGWMIADAFARIFAGGSVADSTPTQNVAIISKDYGNVPPASEKNPATVKDYQAQFKALWGV